MAKNDVDELVDTLMFHAEKMSPASRRGFKKFLRGLSRPVQHKLDLRYTDQSRNAKGKHKK